MPRRNRRAVLKGFGPLVAGGLAGCTSRFTAFGGTPDGWPKRSTDEDDPVRWKLEYRSKPANAPVLTEDAIVVTWGRYVGMGGISSVEPTAGTVNWHRELSYAPYRQPILHGNDVYLLTGIRSGHTRVKQQLRRFGLDGTEHWQTEPVRDLLELHALGDERAYLGKTTRHSDNAGRDFPLYAVSLAEGTREWTLETSPGSRGYFHDGRLLVELIDEEFASFDPAAGTERWRTTGVPSTDQRGTPALGTDVAYVERRKRIAALDLRDGSTTWEVELDDHVGGTALADESLVVSSFSRVYGLDRRDGSERWRTETDGSYIISVLADGTALVSDDSAVHAVDATTGERRWRVEIDARWFNSMLAEGTLFVSADDVLQAIDVATGDRRWRIDSDRTVADYGREMAVTVSSSEEDGVIVALDVTDGAELWRYEASELGGITVGKWHTYAVDDGILVALGTR